MSPDAGTMTTMTTTKSMTVTTNNMRGVLTPAGVVLFALMMCTLMTSITRAATISVLDEKLNLQAIRLQSLDDQAITFFDAQGNYQTRQLSDFLQLRVEIDASQIKEISRNQTTSQKSAEVQQAGPSAQPAGAPVDQSVPAAIASPAVSAYGIVELIDGQRLTGQLTGSDDAGQIMQWEHPLAGQMTFKLDHVRQWRFDASLPALAVALNFDRLVLANGDELLGYVSAVTATQISFTPQGSKESVAIERSRVRAMRLANAPLGTQQAKTLMTLADGSRLRVEKLVIERGQMHFVPALGLSGQLVTADLSELRRLDFASERWQLIPWHELARESLADARVFTMHWPVREKDDVLLMHAPARVVFSLPSDCVAVTAQLALDVELTDPGRAWADFVVTLDAGGDGDEVGVTATLADQVINEKRPVKRLRLTLPKAAAGGWRTMTLTLDPALNGPVMDRLRVTDAWVVVKKR